MMTEYFGKYRGKVVNNMDPLMLGRVQVEVPAVSDHPIGWALPCAPYAGHGVGLFTVPPVGADVWVEFERGDVDYPICSGCFWGESDVSASPALPDRKVFKTEKVTITVDDKAGSLTLEASSGMKIEMGASGIKLDNGQGATIELTGPQVSVNHRALELT